MNCPRIVIAGTQSGVGKTSISLALMAAFKKSGRRVQAFKVGPDYIDPSYHHAATGQPSYNLDSWLLTRETIGWLFQSRAQAAELAIIEGVMGLHDGFGSTEDTGSTAQVAKLLKAPVILVLDVKSMARSAAAMVKGYQSFDPDVKLRGVILNKVGSSRHFTLLKEAIEHYTGVPVLGAVFKDAKIQIPERHLGLTTASENNNLEECLDAMAEMVKGNPQSGQSGIDLGKILEAAESAPPLGDFPKPDFGLSSGARARQGPVRIGIARDRAFSFYYQANLDLLKDLGAELVPFSPIADEKLPEECGALYFGGGFPEVYAKELEANLPLKENIRQSISGGMPVYAECGGLMYLSESIETLDDKAYAMVGAVPGKIKMTQRLQNFGYKEGEMVQGTVLGTAGTRVRGHEFHYSQRILDRETPHSIPYELQDRKKEKKQQEGYFKGPLLASYLHLHFLTDVKWAGRFVASAGSYLQSKLALLTLALYVMHCAASDAHAMHISEGLLPLNWAAFWFAVAIPFVAYGIRKLKKISAADLSFKPLVGLMAAVVFIISCMPIPVPTAGTCSHPCGTGISGILLGPSISIVITAAALLIQALFLAHGGLSTWGADVVSMGVMGSFAGYLTFRALRALKINMVISGFMAGLLADWATYLTTSVEIASGVRGSSPFGPLFTKVLIAFIPTQLPLGILEGAMTAGMVMLLYRRRPDVLIRMKVLRPEETAA